MKISLFVLIALCGCNLAQQHPGAIQCKGKATLAGNGSIDLVGGGNGIISFDCGEGAFIRQNVDVTDTPPPEPPTGSYFQGTDGRRYWSPLEPVRPTPIQPRLVPTPSPPPMIKPLGTEVRPKLIPLPTPRVETPPPSKTDWQWEGSFICDPLCHSQ